MYQADAQFKTVAARFLAQVRERNIKTSIDLVSEESNRYRQLVPPALKFTTYCIINDFEAEKLSGIPIRRDHALLLGNLKSITTAILALGVDELVVIHFPEGAYLLTKDRGEILQPYFCCCNPRRRRRDLRPQHAPDWMCPSRNL
jgi:sugar/nucleoside kinase (ribokinase family)